MDPLEKVTLDGLEKFTYISSLLSNEEREKLQLMLLNNIDVFSWSHSDMIRIMTGPDPDTPPGFPGGPA